MSDSEVDRCFEQVRTRAGADASPLDLVEAAVATSLQLAHTGEVVLDRVVQEAHRAGFSWTQIGDRLGISRQAARQRFAPGAMQLLDADQLEVLPRLQECLEQAADEARKDGCEEVDSPHLLLGLLHTGVAATALDCMGVTRTGVRGAIRELFGEQSGPPATEAPVLSAEAQRTFEGAGRVARDRGQSYVGTEHLLFCLATDPGSPAHRVLTRLGVETAAVKKELAGLVGTPRRRRRRKGATSGQCCSFCGRSARAARVVSASGGACICEDCVRRVDAALSRRPAG